MIKALVTGASGFVGSHLIDYLMENTYWHIDGMVRWRSPLENISHHLPEINSGGRVKLVYGELRDSDSINEVVKASQPDYVFHLAAQSYPKTSFTSALDTYDTNINGTHRVLEALRQFKKDAIIHICSSSEVYGRVPKEKTPITEDCNFHPASPYAISKVGTDLIGRHYAEAYGMCVMVTRMGTHTGPRRGDCFHESSFAKQIAMALHGQTDTILVGNLESTRTYANVHDAVRAYHMLVTMNPVSGEYYNIAGDYVCKVRHVLDYLCSLHHYRGGRALIIKEDVSRLRPIDADNQIFDYSKFNKHTGWMPRISFETTMCDLFNYWSDKISKGERFLTR